jgi:hypothetical protein
MLIPTRPLVATLLGLTVATVGCAADPADDDGVETDDSAESDEVGTTEDAFTTCRRTRLYVRSKDIGSFSHSKNLATMLLKANCSMKASSVGASYSRLGSVSCYDAGSTINCSAYCDYCR